MLTQQPCGRYRCHAHLTGGKPLARILNYLPNVPAGSWRNKDSGLSGSWIHMLRHMASKTHKTHFTVFRKGMK